MLSACEFGPFRLDGPRRLLLRDGEPVRLTGKALDILLLLVEEKGRLVTKDELMRRIWPDAVVEENNLTVNVSALRKALQEAPGEHRYVVTVPGRGYQFVADVREVLPSDAATDAPPQGAATGPARPGARRWLALAVTLAGAASIALFMRSRAPADGGVSSVAVLPLVNVGQDPELEYLSDGISESLINRLSQLPALRVIARDSAFRYKGPGIPVQEAARALGVEAIVAGRIAQHGPHLSISVELVRASDGTQMWGGRYERDAADLPGLQSEISREIAGHLRLRAGDRRLLSRGESVNPQAYEQLLRGRFHFGKGSDDERRQAIEHFNRALALDPGYALAYAELANAYSILGNDGVIPAPDALLAAEKAARKALELDDTLAEAHRALAYTRQLAWDWPGAEREYQRAVDANPNNAEAHAGYAIFHAIMGRNEKAVAEARRAKELDPLSFRIDTWVFSTLLSARRYDEALAVAREMHELEPANPLAPTYAGYVYSAMGRFPESVAAYRESIRLAGGAAGHSSDRIYLGVAYVGLGKPEEARAILASLQTTPRHVSPAELAVLLGSLGEKDAAFRSLDAAFAAHDVQLQYLNVDPLLDSLRGDPRFASLVRRVGLGPEPPAAPAAARNLLDPP